MGNEREEKVKEVLEQLHTGIENLFDSDRYRDYLTAMSKFSDYSFNNSLLIAIQRPDASAVAGFRAWQDKFSRHVVKGAKGIAIIQPVPYQKTVRREMTDAMGNPVLDEKGNPQKEEVKVAAQSFKVGYVYALEDTEGKPLPEIVSLVDTKVENYDKVMEVLEKVSPVPISVHDFNFAANGYFSHETRDIHVKASLPEGQKVKTTIHEIAHSLLHDKIIGEDPTATQREREVCAESVAFVVSNYLGIDTSEYSFGYIGGWSAGRELKELQDKMEIIRKAANTIISGIEKELQTQQQTQAPVIEAVEVIAVKANIAEEKAVKHHRQRR